MKHIVVVEVTTKARAGASIDLCALDAIKLSQEMQADVTFDHNDHTYYVPFARVRQFVNEICDPPPQVVPIPNRNSTEPV